MYASTGRLALLPTARRKPFSKIKRKRARRDPRKGPIICYQRNPTLSSPSPSLSRSIGSLPAELSFFTSMCIVYSTVDRRCSSVNSVEKYWLEKTPPVPWAEKQTHEAEAKSSHDPGNHRSVFSAALSSVLRASRYHATGLTWVRTSGGGVPPSESDLSRSGLGWEAVAARFAEKKQL